MATKENTAMGIRQNWNDIRVGDIIMALPDYDGCDVNKCVSFQVTFVGKPYIDSIGRKLIIFEGQFADGKKVILEDIPFEENFYHLRNEGKYFYPSVETMLYYNF